MTEHYVMGSTSAELERLQLQGRVFAPHSAHLFTLAGITKGMRVLDVGCGVGDTTMLLAELVGPDGSVIGVDLNSDTLETAAARAAGAGLRNVSFRQGDLLDLRLDEPVDALVGRLILIHLKEPAATVRKLAQLVRDGGVVTFQDYNYSRSRAMPATPLGTKVFGWLASMMAALGMDPRFGDHIVSILADAGLHVRGAASSTPGGPADSVIPRLWAETFRSVLPAVIACGAATEAEVDIDTLAERLAKEVSAANATLWPADLAAAWATVRNR